MTAQQYFQSQTESNPWLKELTPLQQNKIQQMLVEFSLLDLNELQTTDSQ